MRLAPVPLYFAGDPGLAVRMAGESSRTTHGAREAVEACRYLAGLVVGALGGRGKDELLGATFEPAPGLWSREPLAPQVQEVAAGSFRRREPPEIRGTAYVVASLEAALWALDTRRDFREGALLAVSLGDDADTTGAVYGQLGGAVWGESGIRDQWLSVLAERELTRRYADRIGENSHA